MRSYSSTLYKKFNKKSKKSFHKLSLLKETLWPLQAFLTVAILSGNPLDPHYSQKTSLISYTKDCWPSTFIAIKSPFNQEINGANQVENRLLKNLKQSFDHRGPPHTTFILNWYMNRLKPTRHITSHLFSPCPIAWTAKNIPEIAMDCANHSPWTT